MTDKRNWLAVFAPVILALNWVYLIIDRPTFDDAGAFHPPVLQVQVIVLVTIIAFTVFSIWKSINRSSLLLLALGIVLDLVFGLSFLESEVGIYLDTVGTVLVAVILGPQFGALTALLSQSVVFFFFPTAIPFYIINVVVGWLAGMFSHAGGFSNKFTSIVSGIITGILIGLVAAPLMSLGLGDDPTQFEDNPVTLLRRFLGVFVGPLAYPGATSDVLDKTIIFLAVVIVAPYVARWLKIDHPVFQRWV